MEVEMKIRGLMMDPVTNMPIVVLKDVQGQAILPIWVGVYEANAIALEIEKVQTPRPMTHDLLKNVLLGLEVRVQKIVVNELRDDTFYALIWVEREGQMMTIDSRPSDALALATRTSAATRCKRLSSRRFVYWPLNQARTSLSSGTSISRRTVRRQANSKTMPFKMRARLRPAHSPKAPQPRWKHSQAPSGSPIIQYAVKWQNMGVRVSPAPRRAPVATVWTPSKSWKAAPAARRRIVLRMTVSSGVNMRAIHRGKTKSAIPARVM